MVKLKNLSVEEIITALEKCGFYILKQRGSHIKLRRINKKGKKETLVIPNHKEIPKGTIKAIYNQANNYIEKEKLDKYFYTD